MSYLSLDTLESKLEATGALIYRVTNTNPTINDHAPTIGCTWINTDTGEVFVYQGQDGSGYAKWTGQRITYIGNAIPMDVFNDGSCIAFWRFEDNANDDGGNYDLSIAGTITYSPGIIDNSLNLINKPTTTYTRTSTVINRQGIKEISISGWINVASYTGTWVSLWHLSPDNNNNIGNSRQPALFLYSGNNTKFHSCNDGVYTYNLRIDISNGSIVYGQWSHVVQVISIREMKLYINGILTDTYIPSEDFKFNNGYLYIGDCWYIKNHLIDNVRVFLKVLTDTEVQYLYNLEKP